MFLMLIMNIHFHTEEELKAEEKVLEKKVADLEVIDNISSKNLPLQYRNIQRSFHLKKNENFIREILIFLIYIFAQNIYCREF